MDTVGIRGAKRFKYDLVAFHCANKFATIEQSEGAMMKHFEPVSRFDNSAGFGSARGFAVVSVSNGQLDMRFHHSRSIESIVNSTAQV